MGKSRVVPLKFVSVPRLELVAAVLAAELSAVIVRELQFELSPVRLWTDPVVVLRYLHNVSTKFETFVANRIDLLHTISSLNQWCYVPSSVNSADIASKGLWPDKVDSSNAWFCSPMFLRGEYNEWPKQSDFIADPEFASKRTEVGTCTVNIQIPCSEVLHRLFSRYSDFQRLLRAVAWILRFV